MYKNLYLFFFSVFVFAACNNAVESPYPNISFKKMNSLPGNGRSAAVAFAVNGKGYITLGRNSSGEALNDCWQFDPSTESWQQKDSFPGIARVKALAVTVEDKVYVGLGFNNKFGVYSDQSAYLKDFWMYDPANDTWIQKDSFPGSGTDACISFEYNGNIYIGSGFDGHGFSKELWKYITTDDTWSRLENMPLDSRVGSVVCKTGNRIFFGTGYRTLNENDWWEYFPETDSWKKRKSMPDNGREDAVSLSIGNRLFVSTGKHFGGTLTRGYFYNDILEYDAIRDVWYDRGKLPAEARENAISFTINGKGYIGFGDNDKQVFNDLWCFEP